VGILAAVLHPHDPEVGLVLLAAGVSALAGLAGLALWRLSPYAGSLFLLWVVGVTFFNSQVLGPAVRSEPETWPYLLVVGVVVIGLFAYLYRYIRRTCRAV
jgi:hypothetical protein